MFRLFLPFRCFLTLALSLLVNPLALAATVALNIVDQNGLALDRAVVAISSPSLAMAHTVPEVRLMDQVAKRFVPDVIAITTGDSIRFPNSDEIRHHVYSFSVPLTFELPLYSGEPENPVQFKEPGMVIVGCNIHDRMIGNIYIFDKGLHAVSAAGRVVFTEVPNEELTVTIYHPDAVTDPAQSFRIHARELARETTAHAIELKLPEAEPDTSAMSELEKKFLQLRHAH